MFSPVNTERSTYFLITGIRHQSHMVISLREDYFNGSDIEWKDLEKLKLLEKRENLKDFVGKKATKISPHLQEINSFSQLIT
jgi:hypothetical protein